MGVFFSFILLVKHEIAVAYHEVVNVHVGVAMVGNELFYIVEQSLSRRPLHQLAFSRYGEESKPTADSIVDCAGRAVGSVHRANDIEILWHTEALFIF